ncbi:hypothetical protein BBP40_006516 [Aspergillus hancockii]|nr:hypothetical protein BBP40_006516 [Aspergillus hancockii]
MTIYECFSIPRIAGIGTEIAPTSLSSNPFRRRSKFFGGKLLDSALAVSFDQHVLGGYRFLMRHYRSGSRIYIFGFSRGAYTARFLNEMLDVAGLLSADNEEMIPFIWEAFSAYKLTAKGTTPRERAEKEKAQKFLVACRETVSRAVDTVHFLGLFDTVNSTAEFQINTEVRPNAKIIRHALSIDERRVAFYPVLIDPTKEYQHRHRRRQWSHRYTDLKLKSCSAHDSGVGENASQGGGHTCDSSQQDIQEVWFPGGHADVGGGWGFAGTEAWKLSHGPLVWMVQEAQRAGLQFDQEKVGRLISRERQNGGDSSTEESEKPPSDTHAHVLHSLHLSCTKGILHDNLDAGEGISFSTARSWNLMEYIPFRRMVLQPDGSWKLTRWPLHRGKKRDIPKYAQIHVSALERMKADPEYRPANLILHSNMKKKVPINYGIGNWKIGIHEGDRVREAYVRVFSSDYAHPEG